MKLLLKGAIFGVVVSVLWAGVQARGQAVASAQIHGTVTDQSGAPVPAAQIQATQTSTGLVRTTVSTSDGTYVLPNLPVGPYRLQVTLQGFQQYVQSGIVLQVSDNVAINVTMEVGEVSQRVEVNANATMVQTQDTSVSEVIDQKRMVDLPLNGRLATQLVILSGAALNSPARGDLQSSKNYPSSAVISVAGGQGNGNNYLMDGADNNDAFSNVNLPFPFPDALQEFSVQTNGLSAQYGLHPGSVMNVVTKSGTNQFHGDLFEFVRNGAFNARNYFAATQDTLRRNQFGGTVGGPVVKDKLFFFFGYQGTRVATQPPQVISFTATAAALQGDFSSLESSACQSSGKARTIINPATGQAFTNDFVNPALFNPQALAVLQKIPTSSSPCGQITYGIPQPNNEDQYIGRADYNISAKQTLFGRYFISDYAGPAYYNGANLLTTTQPGELERSQSMVLGDTYSFSPTTVSTLHLTWTRLRDDRGPAPNLINPGQLGINVFNGVKNFIDMSVSNHFDIGCGICSPGHFNNNSTQVSDDVVSIHGKHQITYGGEWIHNQLNELSNFKTNGQFSFNGQFSNDPLLDFMLGVPSDFTQGNPEVENWRQNYFGLYAQDDFHATPRLAIHAGLRWEPFLPTVDRYGRGNHFSLAAFQAGTQTSVYSNAPPGLLYVGDPGIPKGYAYNSLLILDPRVGFAWDPTGDGKQTLRGSYSIFYDTPESFYFDRFADSAPWGSSIDIPSPVGGLTNPYTGFPGGDPFPLPFPPAKNALFPSEGVYVNLPLNLHPTYMQQWDFSYQRQLPNNWLLSATYIGNHTVHLWGATELDPAVYIPGTCGSSPCSTVKNTNARRTLVLMNPATGGLYSTIAQTYDGAYADYNAMLLSVEHRFSQNFTLLSNYTYSHCLSNTDFTGEVAGPTFQNPANPTGDYGNCGFDLRHNFNTSLVTTSPHFSGLWTNRLLSNWQLSPIFSYHSGFWFNPVTGVDNSLTGINNDRPNVTGVYPYVQDMSTRQWIATAGFVPNALGAFGNVGRNSILGPGYFDVDAEVSRFFKIHEAQQLEARIEFFNLGNNVNFNNPTNNLHSGKFGTILGAGDPRILQLALKYYF